MTDEARRRLAVTLGTLAVVAELTTAVLAVVSGSASKTVGALLAITFSVIGTVVLRSQPRNGVGWVFLVAATFQWMNGLGDRVGSLTLAHHGPYWLAHLAEFITITWFPALFLLITLGLLYFPTGKLPGRTWRWLERATVALMLVWLGTIGVAAWPVPPRELGSSSGPKVHGSALILFDIGSSSIVAIIPCVIGAIVSLILRWRRSGPVERLQIRWVAAAGLVAIAGEIAVDLLPLAGIPIGDTGQTIVESSVFSLIAIATGVAIMRYRLYEIDRIVSRTLSYAAITVLLGATYVGIVTLGAAVIPDSYGSVGVAAATLAVAALFVPLRRGIQRIVDRRFNRSRYDANRTVDTFAVHLRGDLSQSDLATELLRTVQHSVAPASATIWLVPR